MNRKNIDSEMFTIAIFVLIGSLAPLAVIGLLIALAQEAAAFVAARPLSEVFAFEWRPQTDAYGLGALVTGAGAMALLAGVVSVGIGTPAAIRLTFFASPLESAICERALLLMSGLPSIVVGLFGLVCLVPYLGFSLAAGTGALVMMLLPNFTLLLTAALRQRGDELRETCRALGYEERRYAYGEALRAALPSLVAAAALTIGKGLGEATALSLVIGNISSGFPPGLLEPSSAIATVILKDHAAAAGDHLNALYVAAIALAIFILLINAAGALIAQRLRRHTAD